MTAQRWPSVLWIVRHGESAGNVARDAAHAAGATRIALTGRDVDVPLSSRGEEQATALGRWFATGQEDGRPEILLASPYATSGTAAAAPPTSASAATNGCAKRSSASSTG